MINDVLDKTAKWRCEPEQDVIDTLRLAVQDIITKIPQR